jgi:hypothetical protein
VHHSGKWFVEKSTAEGKLIDRTVVIWRRMETTRDEIAV